MTQLPLFDVNSGWIPPSLSSLPRWADARRVSIDWECKDETLTTLGPGVRRGGAVVGFGFALEDDARNRRAFYLPIGHHAGGNLPWENVLQYMVEQAAAYRGVDVVGANLPYELDYAWQLGIRFRPGVKYRDVQVAAPLCNELHKRYNLDAICQRLGIQGKDEAGLREALAAQNRRGKASKNELWRLHSKHVGPYNERDLLAPFEAIDLLEADIAKQGLERVWELETAILPILVKMRRRGVRVNLSKVDEIAEWSVKREEEACAEVTRLTGIKVTVEDTRKKDARVAALKSIGVELPLTQSGQPQLTKDDLDAIDHPVAELLRTAGKFNYLRNTFCASIREHAIGDRIHTTFNQLRASKEGEDEGEGGARYGRLSSSDPNLQNQPNPDKDPEIGPVWRTIFLPEDGCGWACLDFSQQEPRWMVAFAEQLGLTRAREAAQRFRDDPATDNHGMMRDLILEVTGDHATWDGKPGRGRAKIMNLGMGYGMGEAKLCHDLGLPTEVIRLKSGRLCEVAGPEGKRIMEAYHQGAPFVREFAKKLEEVAAKWGYVRTVLGRKCRFPEVKPGVWDWCHKAGNRVVQGSSADQTKEAMRLADEAGHDWIQLQVHDELDGSITDIKQARELAEIMRTCVPCNVPHKADIETGPTWGEVESIDKKS